MAQYALEEGCNVVGVCHIPSPQQHTDHAQQEADESFVMTAGLGVFHACHCVVKVAGGLADPGVCDERRHLINRKAPAQQQVAADMIDELPAPTLAG